MPLGAVRWSASLAFVFGAVMAGVATRPPPPRQPLPGATLAADLDHIQARLAELSQPDPALCERVGCLGGVERVEIRRGLVSCRCRKLPSLGVHRIKRAAHTQTGRGAASDP
jgi:hypothetical protein